ncbi:GNAT family N-acetyltransferase [Desulfosporosinus meridiei]|uniref:Putative acetyltransferase n=1 Tax=Desulfosporosinus meridiei (strain ATCC BAA-275 / DSM 13257 / KCTC 12902 / NCIMB 13706 / S10) TaxID=768704 RepID=J7IRI7_DESMD|nr:GNAT family N-acetyltransferase [Desulfosporosinus meridiei]AFQ44275.1 putative acetyltransferase [Desulfosporosinus meridiei DSM 13257]
MVNIAIRPAEESECDVLTKISFAAKRYWNYPEAYFDIWKTELTITADYIKDNYVYVAEENGQIIGYFSVLEVQEDFMVGNVLLKKGFWLEHIFISPEFIGWGIGTQLISAAKSICIKGNIDGLFVLSDPYAKGFYEKMGAKYKGEVPSSIKGRTVALFELKI